MSLQPVAVLDLRSRSVRWLDSLWRRWAEEPAWLRPLAKATGGLQSRLIAARVAGRGVPAAGPLIVSVGNLRVGGTGKTPVVARLAADLADRGLAGAVVTRGYRSPTVGPLLVDADDVAAGDEARWVARRLVGRGWSVVQARDRLRGVAFAREVAPSPQVILLEDGHQTARVARHLDVLILDRWRIESTDGPARVLPVTGLTLPWGPYREAAAGANRAAVWLVETDEPLPPTMAPGEAPGPALLGFQRHLRLSVSRDRVAAPYGTISGIARPEGFENQCAALLGEAPVLAVRCDDHVTYGAQTWRRIASAGSAARVACWLTTEKDWIKLSGVVETGAAGESTPIFTVGQKVVWQQPKTLPDLIEERFASHPGRRP